MIAHRTAYSPCKICNQPGQRTPLWQVKAERVVYDQTKHKVRFKSATIEVEGVPVAWLPSFSVSDPTVRYATGLLTPEVGNSTKIGYFTRAAHLCRDLVQPGHDRGADGLHLGRRGAGDGIPRPLEQWRHVVAGQRRLQSQWRLGGLARARRPMAISSARAASCSATTGAPASTSQATSNSAYMRFYDISFLDRLVNDVFLEATPGRSRFALTSYYFQGLRSTDVTSRIPFVLPQAGILLHPGPAKWRAAPSAST